ncbi:MAG: hypothetical protein AAF441_18565 [Pseudomonadota bacterium]
MTTTTYTLTLNIPESALRQILAEGQRIAVARQNHGGLADVAWAGIEPAQRTTVGWNDGGYRLYASDSPLAPGTHITQKAGTLATLGSSYVFSTAGSFGPGTATPASDTIEVTNDDTSQPVTLFGLTEAVFVNRLEQAAAPFCALGAHAGTSESFTPTGEVIVWLARGVRSGSIVDPPPFGETRVELSAQKPAVSLTYSEHQGRFVGTDP